MAARSAKTIWLLWPRAFVLLTSIHHTTVFVKADFGDYADLTFECPALTTCSVVCVANESFCPANLQCGHDMELCPDGSCISVEEGCSSDNLDNPCEYDCDPVACKKVVNFYNICKEELKDFDESSMNCDEEEIHLLTFIEPGFLFCYIWITVVTILILGWCAFNQRIHPIPGSTKSIDVPMVKDLDKNSSQTAYRSDFVGGLISFLVYATLIGFHVLLAMLSVFYYQQQGAIPGLVFEDEEQALLVFEIAWMVAVVWSFALKWPYNIRSLFLRRCRFEDASYVAVSAPTTNTDGTGQTIAFLSHIQSSFNSFMAFIFSDGLQSSNCGEVEFCKVYHEGNNKHFYFRLQRYNYDNSKKKFILGEWDVGTTIYELYLAGDENLSETEVYKRSLVVGRNYIKMNRPSFCGSVQHEFSTLFYTYQALIIWTWVPLWYYYMAFIWSTIILIGGLASAYFHYRNESTLYKLSSVEGNVQIFRQGRFVTLSHKDVVPGDVVILEPGITYCDMVLLKQTKVIVDESALTGESSPVAKMGIDIPRNNAEYDPAGTHKKNTILAGTTILESGSTVEDVALVTKTASFTSRGKMLRDILSYKRHQFKFDYEAKVVLLILLVWGIIASTIAFFLIKGSFVYGWFYGVYVFAAALPPLLPTIFVVSVGMSEERLAQKLVTCVNNESILAAGKVNMVLFDKTGTLTKQGLDFQGARSSTEFDKAMPITADESLAMGMASCHTLAKTAVGDVIGHSVDKMMFLASEASMDQSDNSEFSITLKSGSVVNVLKRFDFDHQRMTQSVIVRTQDSKVIVFTKGSAESIVELCRSSTLPQKFDEVVNNCAKEGVYQISIATKELKKDYAGLTRAEIEKDLSFVGAIDFKNVLREESPVVIRELEDGNIQSIMVTGDNVLTGVFIARQCNIIKEEKIVAMATSISEDGVLTWVDEFERTVVLSNDSFMDEFNENNDIFLDGSDRKDHGYALVITGSIWRSLLEMNRDAAMSLVNRIVVFGRCTPNDKATIVTSLNEKGFVTAMCGDGGNDCGALKAAHVGIALSSAEASLVSPFTSLDKSISSILDVLKEGRCALANAFASYKYILMYGQVETINQIATAYFEINFVLWCWVFMDGFWVISMAFTLPRSRAFTILAPESPTASLFSLHTMSSFLGVFFLNFAFLCIGLALLFRQDWFQCRKWNSTDLSNLSQIGDNYESSVIFLIAGYQYISSALAYNFGYSFRASWCNNWLLLFLAGGFTILHFFTTLTESTVSCLFRVNCSNENVLELGPTILTYLAGDTEPPPINNPFNTTVMPVAFRWKLATIMIVNTLAVILYEYFFVNGILKKIVRGNKSKMNPQSNEKASLL